MAHIQHLVEDRDITLGTIKLITLKVASGDLYDAHEKLDGVNIMFTCTPRYECRFARSESDIRSKGMSRPVLEAKYTGRGLVQETFVEGSNAIAAAIRHLSPLDVRRVFDDGKLWYSAEIIYTKNPNVVHYAANSIVFHERPVLRLALDGDTVVREDNPPFSSLVADTLSMDAAALKSGWRVYPPQRVCLRRMDDLAWLKDVHDVAQALGHNDQKLQDVLRERAKEQLSSLGVSGQTLDGAVARLVEDPGRPSLTTLKPKLPAKAVAMLRDSDEWASKELWALDVAVSRFASVALFPVQSALVADHAREMARISERLSKCVKRVEESKNPEAIAILRRQFQKLAHVTPVEGIVFPWGDKIYKLTGSFAPANAVMGLCKYGRGKAIPPLGEG